MDIKEVIKASKDLGEWAHIATVSGSGTPYVTPVHPCWEGETLWIMVGINSVKSKNIADSSSVSLHWQVSEETSFESLIIGVRQSYSRTLKRRQVYGAACSTMTLMYSHHMVPKILQRLVSFLSSQLKRSC